MQGSSSAKSFEYVERLSIKSWEILVGEKIQRVDPSDTNSTFTKSIQKKTNEGPFSEVQLFLKNSNKSLLTSLGTLYP